MSSPPSEMDISFGNDKDDDVSFTASTDEVGTFESSMVVDLSSSRPSSSDTRQVVSSHPYPLQYYCWKDRKHAVLLKVLPTVGQLQQ